MSKVLVSYMEVKYDSVHRSQLCNLIPRYCYSEAAAETCSHCQVW